MSKTRAEVIEQTLSNLGVIAAGQSISASDMQKIDTIMDGVLAELSALNIVTIGDRGQLGPTGGDFDDALYLGVSDYLAYRSLPAFPMSPPTVAALKLASEEAVDRLQAITAPPRSRRELVVDPATRSRAGSWAPFPNNF